MTAAGDTHRLGHRDELIVTSHDVVEGEVAVRFRRLYLAAFAPLRTRAAARHVLTEDEFTAEMTDPRVTKIIAWHGGDAVGMATVTTDLATVPWISPEFFAARYPEHAARSAIYYFGFVLVDPEHTERGVLSAVLEPMFRRIAARDGVFAYDICTFNLDTVDLLGKAHTILDRVGRHHTEQLDAQTYFLTSLDQGRVD